MRVGAVIGLGVGVAVGATAAYSLISGKSLEEILQELQQFVGLKNEDALQPGSMAVSLTPIQGVPELHLGDGKRQDGLFDRRTSTNRYKPGPVITDVNGIAITDDVAIPGSLAVTMAQLDGMSPTLLLGKNIFNQDEEGLISPASIFVRRTSSKQMMLQQDGMLDAHPTMAVTASQLQGRSPDVLLPPVLTRELSDPEASLFERRKVKGGSLKQMPQEGEEYHDPMSMAVSASLLLDGGTPKVSLAGGVYARRQESAKNLNKLLSPSGDGTDERLTVDVGPNPDVLSMKYTAMVDSPTMRLGSQHPASPNHGKSSLFHRRMSNSKEGKGESSPTAQVRAYGEHFKVGAIQSEYAVLEEKLEKAKQSLEAREADYEASDRSLPAGAEQARAWHAKQVADAVAVKQEVEAKLADCKKRLIEAQRAAAAAGASKPESL